MKLPLINKSKTETGKVDLPVQFSEPVREDLIRKAVYIFEMNQIQAYGADPMAGNKYSSKLSKRRRAYRGSYGFGISRTPRKIISRRGRRLNWIGATAPNTVGGARAHAPKAEKINERDMPIKERRKAIRSAIAATILPETVKARGHRVPLNYPFILDDDICKIAKTNDLHKTLIKLGFTEELERTSVRKVRAGRGKSRGRKYKTKRGILFVVATTCNLQKSALNIPGAEIVSVENLNVELLAPGRNPGRLTIWTKGALNKLNEGLFL